MFLRNKTLYGIILLGEMGLLLLWVLVKISNDKENDHF